MSLEQRITPDLKNAMKSKDQAALRSIRAIKAAIILVKTDGSGVELDNAGEIKLLQRLVKQRQESYDIFAKEGRDELAKKEMEEIEIIQKYLPAQMDQTELTELIKVIISETGAQSMKDMGKVMGIASGKLAGKADGKSISNVVKTLLG